MMKIKKMMKMKKNNEIERNERGKMKKKQRGIKLIKKNKKKSFIVHINMDFSKFFGIAG